MKRIRQMTPLLIGMIVLMALAGCRYARNAADTAYNQFSPSALLAKYESFKNMAAAIDAKDADILVAKIRLTGMEDMYKGTARKDWPRQDLEQYNQWSSEVAGIIMSYNSLAGDYNANMAKLNYSFCNTGTLPKGADTPLPREFRAYKTN